MPEPVESHDPEGVDYGWVMQTTFVTTIVVGSPIVALLSVTTSLPSWGARAAFAVRVGAVVWFLTAICVFGYALVTDRDESVPAADESERADDESDEADGESGEADGESEQSGDESQRADDESGEADDSTAASDDPTAASDDSTAASDDGPV